MLFEFFRTQLAKFDESDLDPIGRRIIEACLDRVPVEQYTDIMNERVPQLV
jgi:hypothetical protein